MISVVLYIIAGFVLFTILWLANKAIQSAVAAEKIHPAFQRVFPVAEFLLWFLYLLWALRGIFSHWHFYNILMYAVIIAIIIGIGWFIAKDFIAGIVLKSEVPFKTGQYIGFLQTSGILKNLGYRSLEIETDVGQRIKIPYSRLTGEVITCQPNPDGVKGYETIITLQKNLKNEDVYELIVKRAMLLPWTIPVKKPTVKLLDNENEPEKRYLVKYFAVNPRHAERISQHIKEYFKKLDDKK